MHTPLAKRLGPVDQWLFGGRSGFQADRSGRSVVLMAIAALVGLLGSSLGNAQALDEGIPAPQLSELKGATVFIKVQGRSWTGSASGFLIKTAGNTGYVVTNEHVIHPMAERIETAPLPPTMPDRRGRPGSRMPFPQRVRVDLSEPTIFLVFHSGTGHEVTVPAKVAGSDAQTDLAVLKFSGVKTLPKPLNLDYTPELRETMPVYIFGFPFGKALALNQGGPAISVNKGTISSIRNDDRGEPAIVQIDGAINPGNSGGPVVDVHGNLVGIAVATIKGSGIGFAVPPQQLKTLLDGKVGSVRLIPTKVENGMANIEIRVELIDPLEQIKSVMLHYLQTNQPVNQTEDKKRKAWFELPGSKRLALRIEQQKALANLQLPRRGSEDLALAFQVSSINLSGAPSFTRPSFTRLVLPQPTSRPASSKSVSVSATAPVMGLPSSPLKTEPNSLAPGRTVKPLPAAVADVAIGGGGRYLIFHLPSLYKLAIFDTTQLRVVHYLGVSDQNLKFAAGRDQLLIGLPDAKRIERWSLTSFEREATAPFEAPMTELVMGSASDGPLLVSGRFYDINTFKPLDFQKQDQTIIPGGWRIRSSADGRVYSFWALGTSDDQIYSYVIGSPSIVVNSRSRSRGAVIPAPNGQILFTRMALLTVSGDPIGDPNLAWGCLQLPAVSGNYYLAVNLNDLNRKGPCVYLTGDDRPLVRLDDIEFGDEVNLSCDEVLAPDKRIFFYPNLKLLITLPTTNDRLVIHKVDLEVALEKSDTDYLYLASPPPAAVKKGQALDSRLDIKSRRGGASCRVESGPEGMKVSPEGHLTWAVPPDWSKRDVLVTLMLSDATGQVHRHSLVFGVQD